MGKRRLLVYVLMVALLVLGSAPAHASESSVGDPMAAPAESSAVHPRPRPHTTTVRYGPFNVPGAMGEEPGMIENVIVRAGGCRTLGFCTDLPVEKPCADCFITRIVPNLVDPATGETINFGNEGMLHHAVNLSWSRPDVTCPPGRAGGLIGLLGAFEGGNDRFFATGNERTAFEMPRGYGLPVSSGDEWGSIVDLMNMMPEPRDMALEYTFTWVRSGVRPVTPVWLDVDNCGDSEVDVPVGYSDTEWDWESTISGEVVALAGHVHDNGISLGIENVTRGRRLCTSKAGYAKGSTFAPAGPGSGTDRLHPARWWRMTRSDHPDARLDGYEGHIAGATGCTPHSRLAEGDTIRLHAQYNLGEMAHGDGVMGISVAYVHPRA